MRLFCYSNPLFKKLFFLPGFFACVFSTEAGGTIVSSNTGSKTDTLGKELVTTRTSPANSFVFSKSTKLETVQPQGCSTSIFYMKIPAPAGNKIELKELQTTPSHHFIVAGNNIIGPQREGFVLEMNNSGALLNQQMISIGGQSTNVQDVKLLMSGKLVVTGFVNGNNTAFITMLNSDFSPFWTKTISLPSQPLKSVADLDYLDGAICFAAQTTASLVFASVDTTGSLQWMKQASVAGVVELSGFSDMSWTELGLVTNCLRNGKKTVETITISKLNGNVLGSHTFDNGTEENISFETTGFNARLNSLGVVKKQDGSFRLVRNGYYTSSSVETRHEYTLTGIDFGVTGALDNSADAIGVVLPQTGRLVFIKHFSNYQTHPDFAKQYDVPVGASLQSIARSFDGGFLFGLNTGDYGQLVLVKTDSSGVLPSCGYADAGYSYTESLSSPAYVSTNSVSTANFGLNVGFTSFTSASYNTEFLCNETYCPLPPVEDACLTTYYKTFRSHSFSDAFSGYWLMRNNRHLVTTERRERILGGATQAGNSIKLLDEKGNYVKGVIPMADGAPVGSNINKLTDSTIMVASFMSKNNIPRYCFTLMTDDLDIVWSRSFSTYTGFEFTSTTVGPVYVHRDEKGDYYAAATSLGFMEPPKLLVFKLDASGNFVWTKAYSCNANLTFGPCAVTSTPTSLIIVIEASQKGVSVRVDKTSGNILNAYTYQNDWSGSVYQRSLTYSNNRIYYAGNNKADAMLATFDTVGKILKIKTIPQSAGTNAVAVKDGMLYATYKDFYTQPYGDVILKADSNLNLLFFKTYPDIKYDYAKGLSVSESGDIYVGGSFFHGGDLGLTYYDPFLKKFNSQGELGTCAYSSAAPVLVDVDPQVGTISFTPISKSLSPENISFTTINDDDGPQLAELLCSSAPQCHFIKLSGVQTVCGLNTAHSIFIQKDALCKQAPQWSFDLSAVELKKSIDSVAVFQFHKTGTFMLKAKLTDGCSSFADSILVTVLNSPGFLNIGADTSICKGNTILLNAKKGFASYQWQDNSSDSTFLVTAPGSYWVTVTDGCSNTFYDTVLISKAPPVAFTPLADRWKCNDDTLHLTANGGFIGYAWSPDYNTSSTSEQTLIVNPKKDTTYYLAAEKTPGCFIYDTVQVRVYHSPAFDLGRDTSFCGGQQVVLQAGSGFNSYTWSTGATTQQITINKAGNYSVIATTADGCHSFDTLRVVTVYSNPVVSLDKNPGLCVGSTRQLDGGNFSKYLWQDGSTNKQYAVKSTGVYYVQVTDGNNCIGSDTTVITTLYPLPAGFLPKDTSICNYESLQLKTSASYQRYVWSNGSTASFSRIERAGSYWLQVTDKNNCTGKDTIVVYAKECLAGLYVPNAFTPNKDAKNDQFRARLFGNIKSFELTVYNRWGQIVFVSNDPLKGWDGKYAGKEQDSAVFLWICRYQLEGEQEKIEKGTVTLIR